MTEAESLDVNRMKQQDWKSLLIVGANKLRTSFLCTSECFSLPHMEVHFYGAGPYKNEIHPTTLFKGL
jgi:hypothetical protein